MQAARQERVDRIGCLCPVAAPGDLGAQVSRGDLGGEPVQVRARIRARQQEEGDDRAVVAALIAERVRRMGTSQQETLCAALDQMPSDGWADRAIRSALTLTPKPRRSL